MLPTWLLSIYLSPFTSGGFLLAFCLPTPSLSTRCSFDGAWPLGDASWLLGVLLASFKASPSSLLSWPKGFHGNLRSSLGTCPRTQDYQGFKLLPHRPCPNLAVLARSSDPSSLPSIRGLHGRGVMGGKGQHDGGALHRSGGGAEAPPMYP